MRILHISTRLILGGSQENTVLSCEGQARAGHEVHLAFGPIYGPEGSLLERVEKFRTQDGRKITTHVIPHLIREVNPITDWRGYRELKRLIRSINPDIVHTHSSKAGILGRAAAWAVHTIPNSGAAPLSSGIATGSWARGPEAEFVPPDQHLRRAIGIIHTIHGPPFMPIEGSAVQRAKIAVNNGVYTLAERYAARRCHVIVSVADAMTRQFLARRIGRAEQYTTVYSGMEVEEFLEERGSESRGTQELASESRAIQDTRAAARARLGFGEGDFIIGTVARLAQHKGHDDLLDALAEDLKAHPTWRLLWVGDGWWRQRLIQKARALGVSIAERDRGGTHAASIILTGLVPPQRVPGLIRAMDVLAHPSYREGLPRTVPQALLCGVVPLANDVDGTGEICRDYQTGRLVRAGDIAQLREAARWLYDHPDERRAMAERGRAECAARFSAARMVAELERVYATALERARRSD
ncbi:MAG: glycosyltransferase [Phycisphaerales bacterium]|nr:glycosyltransferase [Phycisphaerales bacterium]